MTESKQSGISGSTIAIVVLALIVGVVGYMMITGEDVTLPGVSPGDEGIDVPTVGAMYEGTATYTLNVWGGTGSAIASDTSVTMYVTAPDAYVDIYNAREALDTQGLVSPYNDGGFARQDTPDANGQVQFSVNAVGEESGQRTTYQVYIHDTDAEAATPGTNSSPGYCDLIGTTFMTATKNQDGGITCNPFTIAGTPSLGATITMYDLGNVSVYDGAGGDYDRATFTRDTAANASLTEEEFGFTVRLFDDNTVVENVGVYVEELDSYAGTALLDLNEMTISVDGVQYIAAITEVSDFPSTSPIKRNMPTESGTGTSTMYYMTWTANGMEQAGFDLQRTTSTNVEEVLITISDFDVDLSAVTTTDSARVKFHLVPFNGYKNSDTQLEQFSFVIGETEGSTGWA